MKSVVVPGAFYARPALVVAEQLIGKYLVRQVDGERISALIHETEAYVGPEDLACHASKGCTPRTSVMFGPAGRWYVYFIYGIHWMLNVVTESKGFPAAVLLRGAGPWDGPAKLTRSMRIDKQFNGHKTTRSSGLWIEDRGEAVEPARIQRTARIGVDFAAEWAEKPYRFVLEDWRELVERTTSGLKHRDRVALD